MWVGMLWGHGIRRHIKALLRQATLYATTSITPLNTPLLSSIYYRHHCTPLRLPGQPQLQSYRHYHLRFRFCYRDIKYGPPLPPLHNGATGKCHNTGVYYFISFQYACHCHHCHCQSGGHHINWLYYGRGNIIIIGLRRLIRLSSSSSPNNKYTAKECAPRLWQYRPGSGAVNGTVNFTVITPARLNSAAHRLISCQRRQPHVIITCHGHHHGISIRWVVALAAVTSIRLAIINISHARHIRCFRSLSKWVWLSFLRCSRYHHTIINKLHYRHCLIEIFYQMGHEYYYCLLFYCHINTIRRSLISSIANTVFKCSLSSSLYRYYISSLVRARRRYCHITITTPRRLH